MTDQPARSPTCRPRRCRTIQRTGVLVAGRWTRAAAHVRDLHGCRLCFKFATRSEPLRPHRRRADTALRRGRRGRAGARHVLSVQLCDINCPTPNATTMRTGWIPEARASPARRPRASRLFPCESRSSRGPTRRRVARASSAWPRDERFAPTAGCWKALGIHREKWLPRFAATTFERWARRVGRLGRPGGEAVLFQTC